MTGIDGGTPTPVSTGTGPDERNASWSPDGRRVAWIMPTSAYYAPTQPVRQYRVHWSARDAQGRWSAPTKVPFNGRILTLGWTADGASLIGIDSAWHFVAQPIAGGPARRVGDDAIIDSTMLPSGIPATSSDGRTLYFCSVCNT